MRRIVYLYITREDFLSIKPLSEGGTILDGRRYAQLTDPKKQLAEIGKPNKTGEGVIDKVWFLEVLELEKYMDEEAGDYNVERELKVVAAKIVDHYESEQELQKELSLIKAKIKLNDKENNN